MIESHATVLLVDDVAGQIDRYVRKLGFEGHAWQANPHEYGYVSRDDCHVHFARLSVGRPNPNSELVPPDMFDLYVYVEDVEELHAELAERGAEILNAPVTTEYGMHEFRVRDPEGYVLAFGKVPE